MNAAEVLLSNWRGRYTVPASGLYPHQWSWDSAFHAIGLRHLSPLRAQQELESLLSAQWDDGRLPQIVFDLSRDDDYSPGAAFWRTGNGRVPTAGLVQPAVHAWAALLVHEADPDLSSRRGFLGRAYPRLVAWHDYLRLRRDHGRAGLASIVHPWESLDNSPLWDAALARIDVPGTGDAPPRPDLLHARPGERPTDEDYRRYLFIAAAYRDSGCDDRAPHPFRIEDPGFNALLARSELALATIAELAGTSPEPHLDRAAAIGTALERLWADELGCHTARDLVTDELVPSRTVSGLLPLLLPAGRRTGELLATLRGEHFGLGRAKLVPSHDLTAPTFDPACYWRGPSWFNTGWLMVQALAAHDLTAEADALAADLVTLAHDHDFPEYIDPHTGEPHGTRNFSWTAALALDLAAAGQPR